MLEIEKDFDKLADKVKRVKNKLLKQSSEVILNHVKHLTPVDKGTLRNAWKRTDVYDNQISVYNKTNYAAHVEYGHRIKKYGRFTGRVTAGRYMLRDGIKEADEDIKAVLNSVLEV